LSSYSGRSEKVEDIDLTYLVVKHNEEQGRVKVCSEEDVLLLRFSSSQSLQEVRIRCVWGKKIIARAKRLTLTSSWNAEK